MFKPKIAHIDLTKRTVSYDYIPSEIVRMFLGARGVNSYLLYTNTDKSTEPFGPENPLIIGNGLLTGLSGPTTSRATISAKSPESGLLGDANIGGHFGAGMKRTGIDYLMIKGQADVPVYLEVADNKIVIKDAKHLWGKDSHETRDALEKEYGKDAQMLCIGQGGENLVRFAAVMHGKKGAAARTGMGAVMGSKRLKAVVVNGTQKVEAHDPEGFKEYTKNINEKMKKEFLIEALSKYGTSHLYDVINNNIEMGRTYNGLSSRFTENIDISPETLRTKYYNGRHACFSCTVACRHKYLIKDGPNKGLSGEGPEYSVIGNLGPLCGIKEIESVLLINDLLNRYGLDACSTGNMIAWSIELYKNGIITKSDTSGIELDWGRADIVMELVRQIAERKDFGNILADGAKECVKRFGKESARYISWIKNMPQSCPVDLRFLTAYAIGMAVSTRGADHLRSRCPWEAFELKAEKLEDIYGGPVDPNPHGYKGKGRVVWWWEAYLGLFDAMGMCKLILFHCLPGVWNFDVYSDLIRLGTGIELTADEVFDAGDRITTIERMFLVREGITRKDDTLPERYFNPLIMNDGLDEYTKNLKIDRERFNEALDEYYNLHGWDMETGMPKEETLERLGLGSLIGVKI